MNAFTDRLYWTWLHCHQRGGAPRPGYGALPHVSEATRREGYPTGQRLPHRGYGPMRPARPMPAVGSASRDGSQRATDAASRPDKPAVLASQRALFLPALEKSSTKS
jgi:hypothetical protein